MVETIEHLNKRIEINENSKKLILMLDALDCFLKKDDKPGIIEIIRNNIFQKEDFMNKIIKNIKSSFKKS